MTGKGGTIRKGLIITDRQRARDKQASVCLQAQRFHTKFFSATAGSLALGAALPSLRENFETICSVEWKSLLAEGDFFGIWTI